MEYKTSDASYNAPTCTLLDMGNVIGTFFDDPRYGSYYNTNVVPLYEVRQW